jgi:hypothetical protein
MKSFTKQVPVVFICPQSYNIQIMLEDTGDSKCVYTEVYSSDVPVKIIDRTVSVVEAMGHTVERLSDREVRVTFSAPASNISNAMISEMELIRDAHTPMLTLTPVSPHPLPLFPPKLFSSLNTCSKESEK